MFNVDIIASVLTPPSPLPSYTDSPSFSQLTLMPVLNKEKKNEVISKKKMLKSNIKLWISICISWDFCSNPLIHLFLGYLYQFLGILSTFEKGFSHRFSCQMNKSGVEWFVEDGLFLSPLALLILNFTGAYLLSVYNPLNSSQKLWYGPHCP